MIYFLKKYWKHISIFCSLIILVIVGYLSYENDNKINTISEKKLSVTKQDEKFDKLEEKNVVVDIKGAVNTPGVYSLKEESRVIDAINLAGGLMDDAYTINLNLSKKLIDEMYIIVYTIQIII